MCFRSTSKHIVKSVIAIFFDYSNRDLVVLLGRCTFEREIGGPVCATDDTAMHHLAMKSTDNGYVCVSLV